MVSLLTMSVEPVDPFAAIPTFPELTTERFVLREITIADAAWYRAHLTWPETEQGQGMRGPKNLKEARALLRHAVTANFAERSGITWGIAFKGDDKLVGGCGFHEWNHAWRSAEIGYNLDPGSGGRGVMTEALTAILDFGFTRMGLNRVQATIMPRNERSLGLVERLGFVREGIMREHGTDENGEFVDDVLLALLRRAWRVSDRSSAPLCARPPSR